MKTENFFGRKFHQYLLPVDLDDDIPFPHSCSVACCPSLVRLSCDFAILTFTVKDRPEEKNTLTVCTLVGQEESESVASLIAVHDQCPALLDLLRTGIDEMPKSQIEKRNMESTSQVSRREKRNVDISFLDREENENFCKQNGEILNIFSSFEMRREIQKYFL